MLVKIFPAEQFFIGKTLICWIETFCRTVSKLFEFSMETSQAVPICLVSWELLFPGSMSSRLPRMLSSTQSSSCLPGASTCLVSWDPWLLSGPLSRLPEMKLTRPLASPPAWLGSWARSFKKIVINFLWNGPSSSKYFHPVEKFLFGFGIKQIFYCIFFPARWKSPFLEWIYNPYLPHFIYPVFN